MTYTKTVLREGNGQRPSRGQSVTVHCTGYGKDRDLSKKFWSTKDPGQEPFTFSVGLGQVIKGWDEGVITMSKGEIARLHCSPSYAYGKQFENCISSPQKYCLFSHYSYYYYYTRFNPFITHTFHSCASFE